MMKNHLSLLFVIVACLGLGVRLYKINAPIADWHSFRQVDTASVAQEFTKNGIDLLHPQYHDLSNIQSGKDNPQGYRMVEMPIYQAMSVIVWNYVPQVSLDIVLRLMTVLVSTLSILSIGYLGYHLVSPWAGIWSAILFALLPYSVFYGRSVLPDQHAISLAVASLVLVHIHSRITHKWISWGVFLVACLVSALSVLVKPYALFIFVGVVPLLFSVDKWRISLSKILLISLVTIVPLWWWREWIQQFPEGIPVSQWLYNEGNIRFKGAWWYWLFAERIGKLLFGYWGSMFIALGLTGKKQFLKGNYFILSLLLGAVMFLVIFARGNVQHDYYQQFILPALVLLAAKGIVSFLSVTSILSKVYRVVIVCGVLGFTFMFSWYHIRGFYWINHPEIIEVGNIANELLPKNAKVIAPYNGDTTFLYFTKRTGWPLGFDIPQKIALGATHYVTISATDADLETKELSEKYTVIRRTEKYAIIDLTQPVN